MKTLPGSIGKVVVVAPHPDDEAIGAFGLMTAMRRRGVRIWVVIVSDGAASHPGSRRWPPERLVPERRRETLRAMATLGIGPARVRFLGLPDGALTHDARRLRRRLGREFRRMPQPDLVVGPVADDAHADHRAVAAALVGQWPAPYRLGYRVWPLEASSRGRLRLALDAQSRAAKQRVVRSYRTQAGAITDCATGMTITPRHLRCFAGPAERFQVLR